MRKKIQINFEQGNRVPFSMRLFWSIFAMFLGFMICFLLFQYQREHEFAQEKLKSILNNYNYQLYLQTQYNNEIPLTVQQFIQHIPEKDLRVTIIDPVGKVLFDNSKADGFTNHNDRSDVREARNHKEGIAIRSSHSTGIRYFYTATNMDGHIYRTALPWEPHAEYLLKIDKDFIYFMSIMTLIFFFVLSRFTFSIGQTISKLRDFALNIQRTQKPKEEEYTFPNDELGDISKNIITLYHLQKKAKDALSMEREKLIKHFQYAKEGFAMFTSEQKEILSNNLFIQFMNIISDKQIRQSEEAFNIPELLPIRQFIQEHLNQNNEKVLRESIMSDKNGKIFQIECLLFLDHSYEISIYDISRQEEESRMKRQLTQNIAHELKTPVSSIQGYLETIVQNPNLSEEKRLFFLERCYSQSSRLVDLLRDISVLNRLEEASDMFELSDISISQLIKEVEKECSKEIEEKQIQTEIILPGNPIIHGNYSLLYSIFRNLYDNTITYAGEQTHITINCYKEDAKFYYFSFSDNGVGIAEEHVNRIFERFYRVDKGRSRKIGGTGLGLSIVKNSVHFHKGQISAKSGLGKGLTILFTLKKKI